MRKHLILLMLSIFSFCFSVQAAEITEGGCVVKDGEQEVPLPLKHTEVEAHISGFLYHVAVTQTFENPYARKIEAVYVFPLPHKAAVNNMLIKVGDRTIRGIIKRRVEAQQIYEDARRAGKVAALLDQERPNIFTQSVANIKPGEKIEVTIEYVGAMDYQDDGYNFVFPMVVGPRYIPGAPSSNPPKGAGWAKDTDQVPDASRITPPVLPPGVRSGHDIQVTVHLDAGIPVIKLFSKSHRVEISWEGKNSATVKLNNVDTIPNKDFDLKYEVAGEKPEVAVLTHRPNAKDDGYFMLMIQPKADFQVQEITPKEMIFVVDTSGSMSGEPIAKAKELVRRFLNGMNPNDSFQIIRFSEQASGLSTLPLPNTPENIRRGLSFIEKLQGEGGTQMIEGIKAALDYPADPSRMRIVAFLTDGYIGNEAEIFQAIKSRLGSARLFSFGVGSSVNRYLLDGMARIGRGMVGYVRQDEGGKVAADKFYNRIANPYLIDIQADWNGLQIAGLYPSVIPDLFAGQPIVLYGRYQKPADTNITLRGKIAGKNWSAKIPVKLPAKEQEHDSIASIWARMRIEELTDQQQGGGASDIAEQITQLALTHRLMSAYTSFVAVEETASTEPGDPVRVPAPVTMPEGVSYEGVFGEKDMLALRTASRQVAQYNAAPAKRESGWLGSFERKVSEAFSLKKVTEAQPSSPAKENYSQVKPMDKQDFPTKSKAPAMQKLSCTISLNKTAFKTGETIMLNLNVKNETSSPIKINTYGWPHFDLYLTIRDQQGKVLERHPVKVKIAAFTPGDIILLAPGQIIQRQLTNLVNLYQPITTGKYTISLTLSHHKIYQDEWSGEIVSNTLEFVVK